MIETKIGSLDGSSWEGLCQSVYKRKYQRTYQEMVSSPGDWGIEGFVREQGIAIQCYCPDANYNQAELYEKQRDKITVDLNKLKKYAFQLEQRIGLDERDKIKEWVFLTPKISKNELLAHAMSKTVEVRTWNLSFISDDFKVYLHDIDHYLKEIREVQNLNGEQLIFSTLALNGIEKPENKTEYTDNIVRKNKIRSYRNSLYVEVVHEKLNDKTASEFILGDQIIRRIEIEAPEIYSALSRVINQYEKDVEKLSLTWEDSPAKLISKVEEQLTERIYNESKIVPAICGSDINEIVNHFVSKWIALCPLEIF